MEQILKLEVQEKVYVHKQSLLCEIQTIYIER